VPPLLKRGLQRGGTSLRNTHCLRHFPQGKASDKKIHITSVNFVEQLFNTVAELLCATPIVCGISLKGKGSRQRFHFLIPRVKFKYKIGIVSYSGHFM